MCSSWSGLDFAMTFVVLIAVIVVASFVVAMTVVEVIVGNLISSFLLLGLFNFDLTVRGESDGAPLIPWGSIHRFFLQFFGSSLNFPDCSCPFFFGRFLISELFRRFHNDSFKRISSLPALQPFLAQISSPFKLGLRWFGLRHSPRHILPRRAWRLLV